MILVELHKQWYRVESPVLSIRTRQFFNIIVNVNGNEYEVLKDRTADRTGKSGIIDMLKMKLFADGKTLNDLPMFIDKPEDNKFPRGPLNLGMDASGNLVTVSSMMEDDPRN